MIRSMVLLVVCAASLAALPVGAFGGISVKLARVLPTSGKNDHYIGNRSPLAPSPLIKLPIGCVRPEGWLRGQLTLEADGFSGRLPELSDFCKFETSAWANPKGEGKLGWEELPYWLKGYVSLGYVLPDKRIIDEAGRWVNAIISSRRSDGYFGPQCNRDAVDLWPNMPALFALRTYYEATGDKRVIELMTGYFRWMMTLPLEKVFPGSWQKTRAGESLAMIYWLYNRTGEKWLLDAARVNHERTADWTGGIASWHGVNFCQCFREPAIYYQQTRDERYVKAAERNYDTMIGTYGQVPGGLFGADENCREGYVGPRQGAETCSIAEMMHSGEMLITITGNPVWADRCEDVAFNNLPCSMTPDLKGLHYLTAPNQVQLDRADKAPMYQNGGDMLAYNPYGFRCCQHNVAFGWPYLAEHLWMATPGNGLAAVLYAPCSVEAKVGPGTRVKISEKTDYPFGETIEMAVSIAKPTRFPLSLRIPGWCAGPEISLNGKALALTSPPTPPLRGEGGGGWAIVDREWRDGDRLSLRLPMEVRVRLWDKNRNSVSVYRGPLAYSLKIGERWERVGGSDKWPQLEVYPTTPWNYGLVLDAKDPAASFELAETRRPADQPFTPDAAPVELRAKARRIPSWTLEPNGMIQEVPESPVRSDQPVETIALIPMGCARLRVSAFPTIAP